MVSVLALVGLLVIVGVNTLLATVLSRFFRLRLRTRWGATIFTLFFVPLVLVASLLLASGALRLGGVGFTDDGTVLTVTILTPLMLGYAIDRLWLPSPEAVARELERERRERD